MIVGNFALGLGIGLLFAVVAVALAILLYARNKQLHKAGIRGAKAKAPLLGHHIAGVVMATLLAVSFVSGAVARPAIDEILHHGGAVITSTKVVNPSAGAVALGQGGAWQSADLSIYLPPVMDQGNTNACGAFSVTEAIYGQARMNGMLPPEQFSPWRTYWYDVYGNGQGTSVDMNVAAISGHGLEGFSSWPINRGPYASDNDRAVAFSPVYFNQLFYNGNGGGWNGLQAIKGQLDSGHLVVLLIRSNSGMMNPTDAVTDNGGSFEFNHFVVAYQHTGDVIKIRNSWGINWASNGNVGFSSYATVNTVLGAYVVTSPSRVADWLPKPTATPIPPARPTATSHPVQVPKPGAKVDLDTVNTSTNMKDQPKTSARNVKGLSKGVKVNERPGGTTHWSYVTLGKYGGWVLRSKLTE